MKQVYIQCETYEEWKRQYKRFNSTFDEKSFYNEVPNSLGGSPHPQFTITILDHKVTVWYRRDS